MKYTILLLTILFIPSECLANTDVDIVTRIINEFKTQADSWYSAAQKAAVQLFLLIAIFEVAYIGVMSAIGKDELPQTIQKFVLMILATSFFYACVNNYQEWTIYLIRQFQEIAGDMVHLESNSSNPFQIGLDLLKKINQRIENLSWTEMGIMIAMYLAGFIILICFSLITAKIIVIKCEAIIAMMAALLLLPLGASQLFREYAINTLRYIFSVVFKLFSLQLVIGVGFGFIDTFRFSEVDMSTIAVILGFSIVLLAVSNTIPDTVGSIINGSHIGSGAGIGGAMSMGKAVIGGAVGGAVAGAISTHRAGKIAKAEGAKGVGGMARGTFNAMRSARHQANLTRTSVGTALKERLNTINELKK